MVSGFNNPMGCYSIITNYLIFKFKKNIMTKKIKSILFTFWWMFLIFQTNIVNAFGWFGKEKVNSEIIWNEESADIAVQSIIWAAMTFLYLLAVIYWLWGGFSVMTAGWDEEKVKKWKKIIIHAIIWLVVIWLSSSIINWVVTQLLWTT